jgi:hypothetical protein
VTFVGMIDQTSGTGLSWPPLRSRGGYDATRAVEIRARATRWDQDDRTRAALERLAGQIDKGEPLRRDVPPGYYLDIKI